MAYTIEERHLTEAEHDANVEHGRRAEQLYLAALRDRDTIDPEVFAVIKAEWRASRSVYPKNRVHLLLLNVRSIMVSSVIKFRRLHRFCINIKYVEKTVYRHGFTNVDTITDLLNRIDVVEQIRQWIENSAMSASEDTFYYRIASIFGWNISDDEYHKLIAKRDAVFDEYEKIEIEHDMDNEVESYVTVG